MNQEFYKFNDKSLTVCRVCWVWVYVLSQHKQHYRQYPNIWAQTRLNNCAISGQPELEVNQLPIIHIQFIFIKTYFTINQFYVKLILRYWFLYYLIMVNNLLNWSTKLFSKQIIKIACSYQRFLKWETKCQVLNRFL